MKVFAISDLHLSSVVEKPMDVFGPGWDDHFERIKTKACKNELSAFHSTFLSELERVSDHLTNVGYSIENPTGDEISLI